jgi:outer membrane receptor for ferrienterochelin and colicin
LKPETATTLSTGLAFHPASVPGLRVDVDYFHIDYKNRIDAPITSIVLSLQPEYSPFVTLNPSSALLQNIVNALPAGNFDNLTAGTYNPANVIALGQDIYTNAVKQTYDGVDVTASYHTAFAGGVITASGSASWLEGTQQSSASSAPFEIVGTIYYPTHWRSRDGLQWTRNGWNLAAFVNYVSGEEDNRTAVLAKIASQTTTDLNIGYMFQDAPGLAKDVKLTLTVFNIFDAPPPYAKPYSAYIGPFDSNNYSTIGRVISFAVSKHF